MKIPAIVLLLIAMTADCLVAGDTKRAVVPGTDDLIRYIARRSAPGAQTTLRDASGRTLGTASTAGTRTTFRDSSGRTTGIATVEGNRTVFRDAASHTLWTATASSCATTTYRDAVGRTQRISSKSDGRTTFHDASGRTTSGAMRGIERDGAGREWPDAGLQHDNGRKALTPALKANAPRMGP
jgi:hypothetical protein